MMSFLFSKKQKQRELYGAFKGSARLPVFRFFRKMTSQSTSSGEEAWSVFAS